MKQDKANHDENTDQSETFKCTPFILAMLLALVDFGHNLFFNSYDKWIKSWIFPNSVQTIAPHVVSILIIILVVFLLDRQSEVIMEEEYLQIGSSSFRYYRVDEITEIKLKGGIMVIRTESFWRTGLYNVRKKQREKAHQMLSEWAFNHEIVYRII